MKKVYVLCINDFPEEVCLTKKLADKRVIKHKKRLYEPLTNKEYRTRYVHLHVVPLVKE